MKRVNVAAVHRYYRITKFYDFLKDIALKGLYTVIIFVAAFVIVDYFWLDTDAVLNSIVENNTTGFILGVFYISETILGLIPPEIFIAWTSKTPNPWLYLLAIATVSYAGGITAYFLGKLIYRIPKVRNYIENKIQEHITNIKQWGGFLIIVGAMLPLPHAVVGIACGIIKYPFKYYVLWALFRFLRFYLYGLMIYNIL